MKDLINNGVHQLPHYTEDIGVGKNGLSERDILPKAVRVYSPYRIPMWLTG